MSEVKIIGDAVKNMPWQEGPAEFSGAPVWRYSENPIIGRNPVKEVAIAILLISANSRCVEPPFAIIRTYCF